MSARTKPEAEFLTTGEASLMLRMECGPLFSWGDFLEGTRLNRTKYICYPVERANGKCYYDVEDIILLIDQIKTECPNARAGVPAVRVSSSRINPTYRTSARTKSRRALVRRALATLAKVKA